MNELEVTQRIEEAGIVPVVRAPSRELADRAIDALLEGGISIFEVTLTVPNATELIASLISRLGNRAVIGAGTVLNADDAERCIDAGAQFIVSPGFNQGMVEHARQKGVAVMPGALTPTEVIHAWQAGAAMVKVFPCSAVGGAKYLKALRGPLPNVKLLPTGGVNLETAADYIHAGACALGVGGELVNAAALKAGHSDELTHRARALIQAVQNARSHNGASSSLTA